VIYILLNKTSGPVNIWYIKGSSSVTRDSKDVLRMPEQIHRGRKSSRTGESQQGIEGSGEQLLW
jgi:hypothetical protein